MERKADKMLTREEIVDAFVNEKTVFLGATIWKEPKDLPTIEKFTKGKITGLTFSNADLEEIGCATFAADDGTIHYVHKYELKNLFTAPMLQMMLLKAR